MSRCDFVPLKLEDSEEAFISVVPCREVYQNVDRVSQFGTAPCVAS